MYPPVPADERKLQEKHDRPKRGWTKAPRNWEQKLTSWLPSKKPNARGTCVECGHKLDEDTGDCYGGSEWYCHDMHACLARAGVDLGESMVWAQDGAVMVEPGTKVVPPREAGAARHKRGYCDQAMCSRRGKWKYRGEVFCGTCMQDELRSAKEEVAS